MKRFIILLPLLFLFSFPALAAEKPKDYIFRGMPDYELREQTRNFERIKIKTPKPESKSFTETTYEGNRVISHYYFKGADKNAIPSQLQILRNYQNAVKKLNGEILFDGEQEFHASFKRNDKQYYMIVKCYNYNGARYSTTILELADLQMDVDIVDADTIIHKLEKEGHIALYINFDSGKSTIKPESNEVIGEVVTALKSKAGMKVKLEGHTDNVGNAAANKKLSDERANAVMNALVAKGIDKSRLSAEGFGLEKPIADNSTEAGRAKNRRVELVKL